MTPRPDPTTRLYYVESMQRSFTAHVVSCDRNGDRVEVVLDRTAFYPTSGGQPFDTGTIDGHPVIEVIEREDGAIAHVMEQEIGPGMEVSGVIDWTRRFDHMQQHTGQHILSAVFDRACGVRTMSFHLGAEVSSIDLEREVSTAEIGRVEHEANQVVWSDAPVSIRFVSADEAAGLALRKPSARVGELRLVDIPDVDLSACGGTHVPRTGMVGIVAVTGWERVKGASRISFVCGDRARHFYGRLRDATSAAARRLSVAAEEIPAAIERLQSDVREAAKTREQLEEEISQFRAEALRRQAETIQGGLRVVLTMQPDRDAASLKRLAAAVVSAPGTIAIVVGTGDPAPVVVARARDVAFDAGAWMKRAVERFGGRGGGRSEMAQGGLTATPEAVMGFGREISGSTASESGVNGRGAEQ